jgi:FdhD protein
MQSTQSTIILKNTTKETFQTEDLLAVEEPLEIRILYYENAYPQIKNISVTMRTPSHDDELAIGFLFTEGIINKFNQIKSIQSNQENIIIIELLPDIIIDLSKLDRNFYTSSSCGLCGKTSIDSIRSSRNSYPDKEKIKFTPSFLRMLPEKLKGYQDVFLQTGGLHASALFNSDGDMLIMREDVGRHNALDKLIGASLKQNLIPLTDYVLLLSGRASFELIQKAVMADIKTVAAVGAPSSLAVELAKESDTTLIGFLRNDRFKIYSGEERIIPE